MIISVHIENFKCFKEFDIDLGPFNVLIGPNDSGKTAFLQALMVGTYHIHEPWLMDELTDTIGISTGSSNFWQKRTSVPIRMRFRATSKWAGDKPEWPFLDIESRDDNALVSEVKGEENAPSDWAEQRPNDVGWRTEWFGEAIGKAVYFAFDPRDLRKPSRQTEDMFRMTCTGECFATFLDDILRQDRPAFAALEEKFYERFPDYSRISIDKTGRGHDVAYVLRFETRHDQVLPAEAVSNGVMLSLAYLALCYRPDPPKVLVIEEPEAGVHHASLQQIVTTLRELSDQKHVQIVLTTHSPYLLDCVEPEEVRVFAKDGQGAVHATKLSDHPDVERMKKHFMSGEIWTGLSEEDIVLNRGTDK